MFYFLIDKYLNDYLGQDSENRAFKIYVFGTLLYLILHVLIYSSLFDNYSLVIKYRHYIYYLMLIDALATYMFGNKNKSSNTSNTNNNNSEENDTKEEQEDNEDDESVAMLPSNQRLTRQEIINKFLVKKQNEKVKQENDKDSISINSDNGSSKSEKKEEIKQEVKQDVKEEIKEIEMKEQKEELVMSDTDLLSYRQ